MDTLSIGCDRISELPDSLITQILSYLPTKDSVKTSVLSKRWEFQWLEVSQLVLDANDFIPCQGKGLWSLIDRFWEHNRGPYLKNFKIKYQKGNGTISESVMEWIAEVVHRGVQHLEIENETPVPEPSSSKMKPSGSYRLIRRSGNVDEKEMAEIKRNVDFMPKYMYVSKTLVSLKLVNVGLEDTKFDVSLPCLKIMHLENVYYMGDDGFLIIQRLISASNVLEDLTMDVAVANTPRVVFRKAPSCLLSTLEYVKINKIVMKDEAGIKLVNYFLENSAILKKLTLSLTHSLYASYIQKTFSKMSSTQNLGTTINQEVESYKVLLTSKKLSPSCQVLVY